MPHLRIICLICGGIIRDLLLECVPRAKRSTTAYNTLVNLNPGAAFPCPYCGSLLGLDENRNCRFPLSGWPVLRYGIAELGQRKDYDAEPGDVSLEEWARKHHWLEPGTHEPLSGYQYADHVSPDETVP
jgi:hypothetical protein